MTSSVLDWPAPLRSRHPTSLTGNFSIDPTTLKEIIARVAALPVNVDARDATPQQISLLQAVGGNLDLRDTKITSATREPQRRRQPRPPRHQDDAATRNLTVGRQPRPPRHANNAATREPQRRRRPRPPRHPDNVSYPRTSPSAATSTSTTRPSPASRQPPVGGNLDLSGTLITKLPPSVHSRIGGRIYGP